MTGRVVFVSRPISGRSTLSGDVATEVAIIGAGFTGLNAALRLAEAGVDVTVLDAKQVGWGASGRNGGFCCLGGAKASHQSLKSVIHADGYQGTAQCFDNPCQPESLTDSRE